jgi:chloramphenicol 3-O phosphotransferase
MIPGKIILLNGASSAGKTTILNALQEVMDVPYLNAGIDKFLWMLPKRYLDVPLWHDVFTYAWQDNEEGQNLEIRAGPLGHQLMSGMHRAIAALAMAGNNVIADHVLIEEKWVQECSNLFTDLPALFVGVHCPLEILEERERARGDRTLGQARAYFHTVHAHTVYDMEVDTSLLSANICAQQIKQRLEDGSPPRAFQLLHRSINGRTPFADKDHRN